MSITFTNTFSAPLLDFNISYKLYLTVVTTFCYKGNCPLLNIILGIMYYKHIDFITVYTEFIISAFTIYFFAQIQLIHKNNIKLALLSAVR